VRSSRRLECLVVIIGVVVLVGACDSGSGNPPSNPVPATTGSSTTTTGSTTPATTATTTATTTTQPTTSTLPEIPETLAEFDLATIGLAGAELLVAVADDPGERSQGLMFVESLGDLDGMLFVFDRDVRSGFWMKDTLIRLDIAFFSSDGVFVDGLTMEPCEVDPCPNYRPGGSYRYALEMPAGTMAGGEPELVVDR
jgi:hypothetical protein